MFETITKKSHSKEWALILKAFPNYRKQTAQLCYTDSVSLSGRYWDSGSREVWAVIKHGCVSPIPDRNDFPFTKQDIEVELTDEVIAISTGTFCGKAAQAYIYMMQPKATKMKAALDQLENELIEERIDLDSIRNSADHVDELAEQITKPNSEQVHWVAYCTTCQKELESCPNGAFAEAAARIHKRTNEEHKVIVGTCIK